MGLLDLLFSKSPLSTFFNKRKREDDEHHSEEPLAKKSPCSSPSRSRSQQVHKKPLPEVPREILGVAEAIRTTENPIADLIYIVPPEGKGFVWRDDIKPPLARDPAATPAGARLTSTYTRHRGRSSYLRTPGVHPRDKQVGMGNFGTKPTAEDLVDRDWLKQEVDNFVKEGQPGARKQTTTAVEEIDLTAAQDVNGPSEKFAAAETHKEDVLVRARKALLRDGRAESSKYDGQGAAVDFKTYAQDDTCQVRKSAKDAVEKLAQTHETVTQNLQFNYNKLDLLRADSADAKEEEAKKLGKELAALQLQRTREKLPSRPLPEIQDEWIERYNDAVDQRRGKASEMLIAHANSKIDIHRKDMHTMAPGQWVNDEIINVYMRMIQDRDAAAREKKAGYPVCHIFNSFFANKLYKDSGYDYSGVRRWTMPNRLKLAGNPSQSVLDCDRIILPVHQAMHWVCAVIDIKNKTLIYLDSLKGEDHRCLESLARYLQDEYKNKRNEEVDVLSWEREYPKNIPEQKNGCDCGVFTMLFADYMSMGAKWNFTQDDIQDFRVQIVHNIFEGELKLE